MLYDSLQLAHKCILNSFYGYVMRKYISYIPNCSFFGDIYIEGQFPLNSRYLKVTLYKIHYNCM